MRVSRINKLKWWLFLACEFHLLVLTERHINTSGKSQIHQAEDQKDGQGFHHQSYLSFI